MITDHQEQLADVPDSGYSILIVAYDFPYPPNHGARVDVWGRIKALRMMGHTVDFAGMVTEMPPERDLSVVKEYVRNVYLVAMQQVVMRKQVLSRLPTAFNMMQNLGSIEHVNFTEQYDFLFLDGDASIIVLDNPSLKACYTALRVHNNEANYFIALARSTGNIKMKIFYIAEYLKYKAISKRIFSKIDRLLFISYDEYRASLQLWGKDKCLFFPAALEEEVAGIITESSTEVLFIGNLFADNNIDGLRWYLDNVHSLVSTHKGYRLIIAGNTRGAGVPWLRKYLGCFDNIEFIDTPYDLMPLYNRSRVFVNPIRYGAGVKIKNLTALWNGLAVVSTPVGNEGTGLQHNKDVLLAHSAVDFAEKIIQLLDDNELRIRLTNSAQKFLQLGYNQKNNLSQVLTSARTTK